MWFDARGLTPGEVVVYRMHDSGVLGVCEDLVLLPWTEFLMS